MMCMKLKSILNERKGSACSLYVWNYEHLTAITEDEQLRSVER